jgi:hypothetical protein
VWSYFSCRNQSGRREADDGFHFLTLLVYVGLCDLLNENVLRDPVISQYFVMLCHWL